MKKFLLVSTIFMSLGLMFTSCSTPGSTAGGSGEPEYLISEAGLVWMEDFICHHWQSVGWAPIKNNIVFNKDHTGRYWTWEEGWGPYSFVPPEEYITNFTWSFNRITGKLELRIGNNLIENVKIHDKDPEDILDYIIFDQFDNQTNIRYYKVQ